MWRHGFIRAIRAFRTDRVFAWMVITGFASGIFISALAFAMVDAVVLRPLPFRNSDRLAMLWTTRGNSLRISVSGPDFLDWQSKLTTVESLAALEPTSFEVRLSDRLLEATGARATSNLFFVLDTPLQCGSGFAGENEQSQIAIISHSLWVTALSGAPDICGKTLQIDGLATTVVGVLPERFHLSYVGHDYDIFMPLPAQKLGAMGRMERSLRVIARLRAGAGTDRLNSELRVISANLSAAFPASNRRFGAWGEGLRYWLLRDSPRIVWTVLGIVMLVCLIALGNIAALFMARGARMLNSVRLRLAIGARPSMIASESLAEGLTFALLGYLVGIISLAAFLPLFARLVPPGILRAGEVWIDWRILAFGAVFAIAAALAVTVPPAFFALKESNLRSTALMERSVQGDSKIAARFRNAVMAVEFAVAVMVLTVGLMATSEFIRLKTAPMGFVPDRVITAELSAASQRYHDDDSLIRYFDQVEERVREIPGVRAAALTTTFPLSGDDQIVHLAASADAVTSFEAASLTAGYRAVGADYFEVLQIPLLRGSGLSHRNVADPAFSLAVINRSLADRLWPGADPIGRDLWIQRSPAEKARLQVVGVAENVRHKGLTDGDIENEIYVPYQWEKPRHLFVVAKTNGPARDSFRDAEKAILRIDDKQRLSADDPKSLASSLDKILQRPRFYASSLLLMTGVSVLLALYGIIGLVSYAVNRRSGEIAIRLCLGARLRHLIVSICGTIMATAVCGLLMGMFACFWLVPGISSRLQLAVPYSVAFQILVLLAAVVCTIITALLPLLKARNIEPAQLFRYD